MFTRFVVCLCQLCRKLAEKVDPMRIKYWEHCAQRLAS
jgi:hypothetical protein